MPGRIFIALALACFLQAEPQPLRFEQDNYGVTIDASGRISIQYEGVTFVNYEMLQLIDKSPGWDSVYAYGLSAQVKVSPHGGGQPVGAHVSESMKETLVFTKEVDVSAQGVQWTIEYETQACGDKVWNYYFLDIPADVVKRGYYEITNDVGVECGEFDGLHHIPQVQRVRTVKIISEQLVLYFEVGGKNVSWKFTDWTESQHKSYRLRIEKEGKDPIKAMVAVKVRAEESSPEKADAAIEKARKLAQQKRQERLRELGLVCDKPLAIKNITENAETIGRFEKFELTFEADGTYDNAFDPEQIDIMCHLKSPSGTSVKVPAFFYQDYERLSDGGFERKGRPVWKVRFAPTEVGRYEYFLTAKDMSGRISSDTGQFECVQGPGVGFVRVSTRNPFYFEFDSGRPYTPIGINLFVSTRLGSPIPRDRLETCERFMRRMADDGGNFVRLRMDSWWIAIEMTPDESTGYLGLGYYNQRACQEVDLIYSIAKYHGIYIMHCLDNANGNVNLREPDARPWRRPYDLYLKENGGICDRHKDFWTSADPARYVRNKLRYCVARWGYSTNCMCWEFWNEVSLRKDMIEDAVKWHRDMARYLREIDPYDHPITTSVMGETVLFKDIFSLPEMEILQVHMYGRRDIGREAQAWAREYTRLYRKPFFLGEFGIGPRCGCPTYDFDDIGLHLHNGLWAPMMAGMSGPGAFWYVGSYIDKKGLYSQLRPVAEYSACVPWNDASLRAAQTSEVRFIKEPRELHYVDLSIPTSNKWAYRRPPVNKFVIEPDGTIENYEMIQPALYRSPARGEPPTFVVDFAKPGKFIVGVGESVGDETNALVVYLDGKKAVEKGFPAGKGLGKTSIYVEQYRNWRTEYDGSVELEVPAGRHEIRPEMRGKDRIEVGYVLTNYLCFEKARPLRVIGVQTADSAYLWIQSKLSTWYEKYLGNEPIPIEGACVDVTGLADGKYSVRWWDTWKGGVSRTDTINCAEGKLTLLIPRIERDAACVVRRL